MNLLWLQSKMDWVASHFSDISDPDQFPNYILSVATDTLNTIPLRYTQWVSDLYEENPQHVIIETLLILTIVYILLFKSASSGYRTKPPKSLSSAEIDELIDEWEPEPLVDPKMTLDFVADVTNVETVLETSAGPRVKVRGYEGTKINLSSYDFLGLASHPALKDAAHECLGEYGCGSCGPRGFYGTTVPHLTLEKDLATFYGTEQAICYSDASSTISSVIPCFAKRGDVLVVDTGVSHMLILGAQLSRAQVYFFNHNDMDHLEHVLQHIRQLDAKAKRPHGSRRHFIITEGLYRDHSDFCPLKELIAIKTKYFCRLIVDDSFGCFCVGQKGRGILDHIDESDLSKVDLFTASCESTLSSVGGFAVGKSDIIEYQRLAGAAYCFSAAQPPFTAAVCSAAIKICGGDEGLQLRKKLAENSKLFQKLISGTSIVPFYIAGDEGSPMFHLRIESEFAQKLSGITNLDVKCKGKDSVRTGVDLILQKFTKELLERNVLATRCIYSPPTKDSLQKQLPPPSIRICLNAMHSLDDINAIVVAFVQTANYLNAAGLVKYVKLYGK